MKVLLIAVGTRGDVEPFLAIAEVLYKNGDQPICVFPEQFENLATESGFEFLGLNKSFLELLETKEGIIAMGGKANFLQKMKAYFILYKKSIKIHRLMTKEQYEYIAKVQPDKIIYHIKSNYPLIHEYQNPGSTILVSPIPYLIHPIDDQAHIGFKTRGKRFNRLTYRIGSYGAVKNVLSASKDVIKDIKISPKELKKSLFKTQMRFSISEIMFSGHENLPKNAKVIGYHERDKILNWSPKEELLNFIEKHDQILFVTFGSMVNSEPEKKSKLILDTIAKLELPAIVHIGSGGIQKPKTSEHQSVFFVERIPYDWLLPKIDFMVHHGGSGTTHMAIKYACPSLIIPHIIDQFLWNEMNNFKGFGPKGVSINKLNQKNFQLLLTELISNETYKKNVQKASKFMNEEQLKNDLYDLVMHES